MKILALNSGSSSIKYQLFDSDLGFQSLKTERIERVFDYPEAMRALFSSQNLQGIEAVGHRIVHGGESFKGPVEINKEVMKEITELSKWAPLHCRPNVIGVEVLQELLPHVPHVAVFDTAAHAEMSSKAFLYGLPLEYYEKYKIRKYGFHGINHAYVAKVAAGLLKKPLEALKVITCHLGNGASITAFEKGKSIDNSMGLTPLEGLVMGTRSGDLDPSVVIYLMQELKLSPEAITELLNKKSGLFGLCGKSDMRDIIATGDKPYQIAIEVFVYRIQKYIGAYMAALDGVDAIVFTGGIGENSPYIRSLIMKNFSYVKALVNEEENKKNQTIISHPDSSVTLMRIPANEEKAIAEQVYIMLRAKYRA